MTSHLKLASIFHIDWHGLSDYYHMTLAAQAVLIAAAIPAVVFLTNLLLFRRPGRPWNKRVLPPISVLIPARNEERWIAGAIEAALRSRGVELELIVLDDGSSDRTAEIVRAIAEEDARVRLETAPPLPEGWNGKQHACWVLASKASHDVFCFLDADVLLGPEALYRTVSEINYVERDEPETALVSGFPRIETATFLELLLLPMIPFLLLGFLPLVGERWTNWSAFAVGCGQFLMVRREPYFECGGHSANPTTMHDGLLLPKLFRRHGFKTAVYDLSRDAGCRMYTTAGEVWRGLAKNATEGMATATRLPVFTVLLLVGQVLPLATLGLAIHFKYEIPIRISLQALALGYGMRFFSAWRYGQSWLGALLHPLGVLALLALEWYAFFGKLFGVKATWKDREYRVE